MVTLQLRQLNVPPGQRLLIQDLDWSEFEAVLAKLGEKRASRLAYCEGTLEIRLPLPEHEIDKELIGDLVKILLEELEIDCECFGSTTFKQKELNIGLEPDQCFYIQNHLQMRGKRRFNPSLDPPPDLALEIDVTSKTQIEAYRRLGIPELWVYDGGDLKIYLLQGGQYQISETSLTFPSLPILDWAAQVLAESQTLGRSPALRRFRQKIRASATSALDFSPD
jgi:Uma2 family endonuclease